MSQYEAKVTDVATVSSADVGGDVGDMLQPHRHGSVQALALAGKLEPAGVTLEHGRAQKILEQLNLPADGGLRHRKLFGGARKIAVTRRRLEHHEAVRRRQYAS
jgi:hypothetical protein